MKSRNDIDLFCNYMAVAWSLQDMITVFVHVSSPNAYDIKYTTYMWLCPVLSCIMCFLNDDVNLIFSVIFYNNVGGVLAMRPSLFQGINGYPNSYWGWGNEDDDLGARYIHRLSSKIENIENVLIIK